MKNFNNYARHFLFLRLLLPMAIIVILNVLLYLFKTDLFAQNSIIIFSGFFFLVSLISIIFYPKFMNVKFHCLRYDKYLDIIIISYEKWLQTIETEIKLIENKELKQFIICQKKKRPKTSELRRKLLVEAQTNKDRILEDHRKCLQDTARQLNFYKYEKFKNSNLLTTLNGKNS